MLLFFRGFPYSIIISFCFLSININAQPQALRSDIQIKELATVNSGTVRIKKDPSSGNLYILENDGDIRRVNFEDNGIATITNVYNESDHGISSTLGIAFGEDGTLFLVGNETNQTNEELGTGIIAKGVPEAPGSENRTWSVIAQTVEYLYGAVYNHRMSGIAVDPGGQFIYVNSGARTDHGEERNGMRETGLTSIILKLPVDGNNIVLQDDRDWLGDNGYLMAEGIRNDFDLAFNGNGDLISVENSGDRDDPEEMNWIREGHHYGFPWRLGGNNTPQQYPSYDPMNDPLLSPNAWGGGDLYATFYNDPDYPPKPDGVTFTEPIMNYGPDADKFRDTATGEVKDASELDSAITTLSSHRSPNGLVFDKDSLLAPDLIGGGFIISINNGQLLQALGDEGQDLLHVDLTKNEQGEYSAEVTRLVSDLNAPLGIELVLNKLYVIETGLWFPSNPDPKLWEIILPPGDVIPVELFSFSGSILNKAVLLTWSTVTELNNYGFEIQRSYGMKSERKWESIGFISGSGTTQDKKNYQFIDKNISEGIIYYRLKQVDLDNTFNYSKEIKINNNKPAEFNLSQNYPNPFNPVTRINFSLPQSLPVTLTIRNTLGQVIEKIIDNKIFPSGKNVINFDGSNLSSGIYFYTLEAGDYNLTKPMILLK